MKRNSPLIAPWATQSPTRKIINKFVGPNQIELNDEIYTDYSSLSFHASFGFTNKTIIKEIQKKASEPNLSFSKYIQEEQSNSARNLLNILKLKGHIYFTTGGSESVDHALKICRDFTGRKIILSRRKSYHGATLGATQVTGDWRRSLNFMPNTGHSWVPEPIEDPTFQKTLKIIKKIGHKNIAGICLESITAKNGVYILPESWINGLRKIQKDYGIQLIFDEIACGFYRSGKAFGFHHYQIKPDIVCIGKAISNGMTPLGAIFFSKNIVKSYHNKTFPSGLTNYAHPLSLSGFKGVCKYTSSKEFKTRFLINKKIIKQWVKSLVPYVKEIRGTGFLFGIELNKNIPKNYFENKNISIITADNNIIFSPTINLPKSVLTKDLDILHKAIKEL